MGILWLNIYVIVVVKALLNYNYFNYKKEMLRHEN